jgi:hypothetical protein
VPGLASRKPFAWTLVLPVAVAELALQVAFANGYGYHRDELYFRAAGRHPAFGYDDQPPLTPLLGRLGEALFGETPRGLRVVSALAVALAVVVVALLALEPVKRGSWSRRRRRQPRCTSWSSGTC